jgi:hypothetical protein
MKTIPQVRQKRRPLLKRCVETLPPGKLGPGITSDLPTIRAEQLRENIRKPTELIRRPRHKGIKSWALCHRR